VSGALMVEALVAAWGATDGMAGSRLKMTRIVREASSHVVTRLSRRLSRSRNDFDTISRYVWRPAIANASGSTLLQHEICFFSIYDVNVSRSDHQIRLSV
jgi:hypothetical protein